MFSKKGLLVVMAMVVLKYCAINSIQTTGKFSQANETLEYVEFIKTFQRHCKVSKETKCIPCDELLLETLKSDRDKRVESQPVYYHFGSNLSANGSMGDFADKVYKTTSKPECLQFLNFTANHILFCLEDVFQTGQLETTCDSLVNDTSTDEGLWRSQSKNQLKSVGMKQVLNTVLPVWNVATLLFILEELNATTNFQNLTSGDCGVFQLENGTNRSDTVRRFSGEYFHKQKKEQNSSEPTFIQSADVSHVVVKTSSILLGEPQRACHLLEHIQEWSLTCSIQSFYLGCFQRNENIDKKIYGFHAPPGLQIKKGRSTIAKRGPGNKRNQPCAVIRVETLYKKLYLAHEAWRLELYEGTWPGRVYSSRILKLFIAKTKMLDVLLNVIILVVFMKGIQAQVKKTIKLKVRSRSFHPSSVLKKFPRFFPTKHKNMKSPMHCPGHNGLVRDAKGNPKEVSQERFSQKKQHVKEDRKSCRHKKGKRNSSGRKCSRTIVENGDTGRPLPVIKAIHTQLYLPTSVKEESPVQDFQTKCTDQFIALYKKYNVGVNNEFLLAASSYLEKFNELCEEKYKRNEHSSPSDEIAVALYSVNSLSLNKFEILLKKFNPNTKSSRNIIFFCCFLLANQNVSLSFSMNNQPENWYITKKELIVDFLNKETKERHNVRSEDVFQFYTDCAKVLRDQQLQQTVEGLKLCRSLDTKCVKVFAPIMQNLTQMVVADGSVYDRARDPPGQRSVYIPPGDVMKETYRLSTFLKYPQEVPVNPRYLASSGFFYTGYKDRVKCFSCGLCVEDWVFGDDVTSQKWHRIDCLFIKKADSGNEPIGSGGLSRFMSPTPTTSPRQQIIADNVKHPESAGSLLLKHASNSNSHTPNQTARPVSAATSSQIPIVEFATISSAYHENFLRNLDLRKESERKRTYEHWPSETPTVSTKDLAKSGFFYLGNLDRVQCFSCGGVLRNWNYGDHVESEHRRHFPHCRMVQGAESRNVRMTNEERETASNSQQIFHEPPDPTEEQARDLCNMFPCNYSVNPHMRNKETRISTFDSRWPSANISATPTQIATAGFFYLGERDRVKCWYCNGGLQNWDKEDEPWTEHAKWFPTCEFLLQRKGPDFVHRMVSMFPNLNRPILRGPYDVPPPQPPRQIGFSSPRAPSPPPQVIDPRAEMQKQEEELRKAMDSDIVKTALEMGFEQKTLKHILKNRLQSNGMYVTVEALVDDITGNMDDDSESDEEFTESLLGVKQPVLAAAAPNSSAMETEDQSSSMQDRIRELQEERNCKICLDKPADVVFVPCGHLCSCKNCAQALKKCPICRRKIEKSIRTYMS